MSNNIETSSSTAEDNGMNIVPFYDEDIVENPFTPGFDIFSKQELEQRKVRAERFNLLNNQTSNAPRNVVLGLGDTEDDMAALKSRTERFQGMANSYEADNFTSLDKEPELNFPAILENDSLALLPSIDVEQEINAFDPQYKRRWNCIHIIGPAMLAYNMTSKDILKKFEGYGAEAVEWITDYRCNVRFVDVFSCQRAISRFSRYRAVDVSRAENYIIDNNVAVDFSIDDLQYVVWRPVDLEAWGIESGSRGGRDRRSRHPGRNHVSYEQKQISMRIATELDVKCHFNERSESLYYKHNIAHYNEIRRKRKQKAAQAEVDRLENPHNYENESLNMEQDSMSLPIAPEMHTETNRLKITKMFNDSVESIKSQSTLNSLSSNAVSSTIQSQQFVAEDGTICKGRGFNNNLLPKSSLESEDIESNAQSSMIEQLDHESHRSRSRSRSPNRPTRDRSYSRDRSRSPNRVNSRHSRYFGISRDRNALIQKYGRNFPRNRDESYLHHDSQQSESLQRPRLAILNLQQKSSRTFGNFLPIETNDNMSNKMFEIHQKKKEEEARILAEIARAEDINSAKDLESAPQNIFEQNQQDQQQSTINYDNPNLTYTQQPIDSHLYASNEAVNEDNNVMYSVEENYEE